MKRHLITISLRRDRIQFEGMIDSATGRETATAANEWTAAAEEHLNNAGFYGDAEAGYGRDHSRADLYVEAGELVLFGCLNGKLRPFEHPTPAQQRFWDTCAAFAEAADASGFETARAAEVSYP